MVVDRQLHEQGAMGRLAGMNVDNLVYTGVASHKSEGMTLQAGVPVVRTTNPFYDMNIHVPLSRAHGPAPWYGTPKLTQPKDHEIKV